MNQEEVAPTTGSEGEELWLLSAFPSRVKVRWGFSLYRGASEPFLRGLTHRAVGDMSGLKGAFQRHFKEGEPIREVRTPEGGPLGERG